MADIDVIYNGDKIVMRLINLDVNYPSDDRVVTYKIINYALNGGAVTISRQTALPARVTSGDVYKRQRWKRPDHSGLL